MAGGERIRGRPGGTGSVISVSVEVCATAPSDVQRKRGTHSRSGMFESRAASQGFLEAFLYVFFIFLYKFPVYLGTSMKLETFEIPLRLKSATETVPHSSPVLEKKSIFQAQAAGQGLQSIPRPGDKLRAHSCQSSRSGLGSCVGVSVS